MGRSRARYARRGGSITKAVVPSLQQGNRTAIPQKTFGLLDAIQSATGRTPYGDIELFPRDPRDDNAFGPGEPLSADPLDRSAAGSGQPAPRIWQYPVSWNLPGNGNREVPWQVLRASAGAVDIIRQCIEARKRHIRGLQWRWSVTSQAVQDAYASDPSKGREDAEATLREQYLPEIQRLTEFWRKPWKSNGLRFGQWINMVMEEMIVLDALAIYPRRALAGNVLDLEVVDGSTIKPLLDVQGRRPSSPFAAFQQVLYGFPRGEYRASGEQIDEQGNIVQLPGGLSSAELIYHVENVRTHSPYGLSPVESALVSARLYLKRQGWMLAEYDDGSTPMTWIEPPENPALAEKFTPNTRRQWEDGLNAELSGDTRKRHRAKVLPPGWTATQTQSVDERYKPEYDIHLIKLVAGHMNVPITELGFSEAKGLGTSGYHEGMAEVSGKVGQRPDVAILSELIGEISREVLGAPIELEFQFIDPAADDTVAANTVQDSQFKRGVITLNDGRRAIGAALYDFPEADMPMIVGVGPTGVVFLDGLFQQQQATAQMALLTQQSTIQQGADEAQAASDEANAPADDSSGDSADAADTEKLVSAEIQAFRRWHRKVGTAPARPFQFKHASPADLDYLADLPRLAEFEDWEYIALDDVELTKVIGADLMKSYEAWWPRDSHGRWIKRVHLSKVEVGPERPHEDTLGKLRAEAARRRSIPAQRAPKTHGRVNDSSGTVTPMTSEHKLSPHEQDAVNHLEGGRGGVTSYTLGSLNAGSYAKLTPEHRAEAERRLREVQTKIGAGRPGEGELVDNAIAALERLKAPGAVDLVNTPDAEIKNLPVDHAARRAEILYGPDRRKWPDWVRKPIERDEKDLSKLSVGAMFDALDEVKKPLPKSGPERKAALERRRAVIAERDRRAAQARGTVGRMVNEWSSGGGEAAPHRDLSGHEAARTEALDYVEQTRTAIRPEDSERGTPNSPAGRAFGSMSENAGWADEPVTSGRFPEPKAPVHSTQAGHRDLAGAVDAQMRYGEIDPERDSRRGTPDSPAGRAFGSMSENAGWADEPAATDELKPGWSKASQRVRARRVADAQARRTDPVADDRPMGPGERVPAAKPETKTAAEHVAALRATESSAAVQEYVNGLTGPQLRAVADEAGIPLRKSDGRKAMADAVRSHFSSLHTSRAFATGVDNMYERNNPRPPHRELAGHSAAALEGSGSGLTSAQVEHGATRAGVTSAAKSLGASPYHPVSVQDVLSRMAGTRRQKAGVLERMFRDREVTLTAPDTHDPAEILARVVSGDPNLQLRITESSEAHRGDNFERGEIGHKGAEPDLGKA